MIPKAQVKKNLIQTWRGMHGRLLSVYVDGKTHEVFNQAKPFEGFNHYDNDRVGLNYQDLIFIECLCSGTIHTIYIVGIKRSY